MTLQHLRSSTANKRPDPTAMADGQIALNTAAASPGLFYKDSAGNLVKAGPVHVGSTAPNVSPASGGTAGNSTGEAWLDTSGSNPLLKIWSGAAWQTVQPVASGTVVSTADTGSVTSTMIANGTIVDADVNASAAIAGTKVSPNFGSQTITTTGVVSAAAGAAATPSITFTGDLNTGIWSPAADTVAASTGGSERLRIDSSGRVGIGTSAPSYPLHVRLDQTASTSVSVQNTSAGSGAYAQFRVDGDSGAGYFGYAGSGSGGTGCYEADYVYLASESSASGLNLGATSGPMRFYTGGITAANERLRITAAGNVGIGTTSASEQLTVVPPSSGGILVSAPNSQAGYVEVAGNASTVRGRIQSGNSDTFVGTLSNHPLLFQTNNTERFRCDTSGRLLVGTSSVRASFERPNINVEGLANAGITICRNNADASGPALEFGKTRSGSIGGVTAVSNSDQLGLIRFYGANGSTLDNEAARISAEVDGTVSGGGANDMPGRLVFSTTADGASSPTERMRIQSDGQWRASNLNYVYAGTDNSASLGLSGFRWSAVWAANGTIQTSDQRTKTEIADAALGGDFIKSLRPVSYKWVEGGKRDTGERDEDGNYIYESVPGDRTHWGFIAQEVKQAVDAAGIDFGGWVLTDKNDPNSEQALRYDQFIAPLTKALQEAMERIEQLEAKVADLEAS